MKDPEALAMSAAALAADQLATDIVVLDLRTLSDVVDFFVLASSDSDMHLNAIATGIQDGLDAAGAALYHREGGTGSKWILLDYVDVVVHLMHPATRAFYSIEDLWGDAPLAKIESKRLAVDAASIGESDDDDA